MMRLFHVDLCSEARLPDQAADRVRPFGRPLWKNRSRAQQMMTKWTRYECYRLILPQLQPGADLDRCDAANP